MTVATVKLWDTVIGYVSMGSGERFARFEFDPDFVQLGIELSPLQMPIMTNKVYQFTNLQTRSFHGLPGMLADSLPDKFGNRLIDIWLERTGRRYDEFNSVDRLCYVGKRGMGALEYEPTIERKDYSNTPLEVEQLLLLASMAFVSKDKLQTNIESFGSVETLLNILKVGASAGGARAKAVVALNPDTHEIRSGQIDSLGKFEHWLIKFDGVKMNGDWGVADPSGYGILEYSYHLMAKACAIDMMECRLLNENSRSHFMTRRFDRPRGRPKVFTQTYAAISHSDYWDSGHYSYEQLFKTMQRLDMPKSSLEEQFRRVVFNLVGCNQDDHVKNFSFLMDRQGHWSIAPAYDLCHSAGSEFTRFHQLRLNGKVTDFDISDIRSLAAFAGLPRGRAKQVLERTIEAFSSWQREAMNLGIPKTLINFVQKTLRLKWT